MGDRKNAIMMLALAKEDLALLEVLRDDDRISNRLFGFHAQQAVEKMLKAVLSLHGVRYRWTHDLVTLIDLLKENGIAFPQELEEARRLNPFATDLRCDDLPDERQERLDRAWAMDCVRRTRRWAEAIIGEQKPTG